MVKRNDVIGYENNKGFREVVLEDVLKMFVEKAHIELVKMPTKKKVDKIAESSTIDLESNEIVNEIIKGNLKKFKKIKPVEGNSIKLLYLFLDKEVLLYAKLKGLKFKKEKKGKDKILEFVDELEEKHPEIKRAVVNSYLKICD
jgi:tRNA(Ile)-lysidine synthase TilS/MesJ